MMHDYWISLTYSCSRCDQVCRNEGGLSYHPVMVLVTDYYLMTETLAVGQLHEGSFSFFIISL